MKFKELTIVIVTFKSEKKIFKCLESIPNDIPVFVIENSNNENFKKNLENNFNNVNCVLTGENKGYSSANNIGLKLVKTNYALILNPDTVLDKDAVNNFFNSANEIKDFWLIGPGNNQSLKINFESNDLLEVNNLKGFAIFFNIRKFKKEYFDENFFLYFEEIDLCKRIKNMNGKIYLDNNIIIKHDGASSVEKSNFLELEKNRNWHWMWSTFYFHKKHKGFLFAFVIIFPKLLSALINTIFYQLIFNSSKRDIYFCRLSGILNSILGKKSWYRPKLD